MSINVLAKKTRARRGASTRTGWTLTTTKSGECSTACGGGAPANQQSTRQRLKHKLASAEINLVGAGWGERRRTASENTEVKVITELLCNNSTSGFASVPCPGDKPTPERHCSCNNCPRCSRRIFEQRCCNIYKFVGPLSNGENMRNKVIERAGGTIVFQPIVLNPCTCKK